MEHQENYFFNAQINQLSHLMTYIATSHLKNFYKQLFEGNILPWQVSLVTGSGPFDEGHLLSLCTKLGFYCDEEYWELDDYLFPENVSRFVIVGRNDFSQIHLRDYMESPVSGDFYYNIFITQEDFINYWLFNIEPNYFHGDPRINDHPGLTYLAEIGKTYNWPWPSTEEGLGIREFDNDDLEGEHPLRFRFGYRVDAKTGLNSVQRQRILDYALTTQSNPLDLKDVVYHIAWLVRTRKNMRKQNLKSAIDKWESDLKYLRKQYYNTQFKWPPTSARSW